MVRVARKQKPFVVLDKMKLVPKYCSYIPVLVKALEKVGGAVLELGTGPHSTMFLHWMCIEQNRPLVSYENNEEYYNLVKCCEGAGVRETNHQVILIEDWDEAEIEEPWGIVLVDHSPAARRKEDVKRLAEHAQCIIIHDSSWKSEKHYHYKDIYPLFKYRYDYKKVKPQTTILSNFIDVAKWWPEGK